MTVWGFGIVQPTAGPLHELCALASEVSGVAFEPFFASSYAELTAAIEDGVVGLAWLPPVPTIELEGRRIASVLAIPARNGQTSYHAAFIVRRGGPKSLADLRGRRAAWVQRDSAAGYLVPRMHLAAQGFDVLRFFARELFVHSHGAVVDAVVNGEADVGATFCHCDKATGKVTKSAWQDDDGQSIRPIETLATMGPIPNDALVAASGLPAHARAALTRWLLSPDANAKALFERLVGSGDFRLAAENHYEMLRHGLRAAHARGHDALPPESRMRMRIGR
ncbi:MAG: phosphate/phosphite/phosphonate ABC transporter substrate-binding protein [Deltaproteobacteria bacterium]|nr:phosphate/phosphite/phosphonate ABC transporter substrate-binding protein [Deltaproteobacteria bacterium]